MYYKNIEERDKLRKKAREWLRNHPLTPEQKAKRKPVRKDWEIKNAQKLSEYQHERWLRDKDKITLRKKNYRINNKIKVSMQKQTSYQKYREKILSNPNFKLYGYKKSAKERGYEFELSTEFFKELLLEKCHYCGKEKASGVDRKDNNVGYRYDNVVPCCKICNFMKRDLSYEDFKDHIRKIVNHLLSSIE